MRQCLWVSSSRRFKGIKIYRNAGDHSPNSSAIS
jgi:hypothetical protein